MGKGKTAGTREPLGLWTVLPSCMCLPCEGWANKLKTPKNE